MTVKLLKELLNDFEDDFEIKFCLYEKINNKGLRTIYDLRYFNATTGDICSSQKFGFLELVDADYKIK